jgi:hypothetical protein
VTVAALRHTAAIDELVRQGVTVVDRDAIEVSGEHARGDEARHAAAYDNGVVTVKTARWWKDVHRT